jgi:hypothetical protein
MTVKSSSVDESLGKNQANLLTYITKKPPVKAGIDPYNKMIDRIPHK